MSREKNIPVIWGIDFGKKLSGNTVICERSAEELVFLKVDKNKKTDEFIVRNIELRKPSLIFIDAPLSLPGVYQGKPYKDYFYRTCLQQLIAMSPMFLGGLTARAIQLKDAIEEMGIDIKETYPKALARQLHLEEKGYRLGKENLEACTQIISETSLIEIDKKQILSWHHFDALLALISAIRYNRGLHYSFGDKEEGLIYT